MRIRFEFQGGYGGLFAAKPLAYDVDIDRLPDEVRTKLKELIQNAGVLEAEEGAAHAPKAGRGRDVYNYRLQIQDGGLRRSMAFDDANAPPKVRPLLQFLQKLAMERRKSRE